MTTLVQLALVFGAVIGLGVFLVVRGTVPAPPALESALADADNGNTARILASSSANSIPSSALAASRTV